MLHRFTTLALTMSVLFAATACGFAQQKKQPDPKELQKAYEAYATPGKEHAQFKRLSGNWSCVVKAFPTPNRPVVSKGTASFRVILGGRFLQQRFRGKLEGQSFEGQGISGFDNSRKKYFTHWIDSMGTGRVQLEGTYDRKTQTLTETGTSSSPLGPMKMKTVTRYSSNDQFLFTMYVVTPNGDQKMLEINYTRAKGKPKKRK